MMTLIGCLFLLAAYLDWQKGQRLSAVCMGWISLIALLFG
ncbi:hypothetical protein GCM10011571_21040 [Marinithermofilum abyssi]|uniref:Uncharacterized protein n=1 Tax=Marinithermofilum abyssi TaxID=1571185 RepID=A0A8J2VI01_9BACL|nr:hypothetical protein GCM10011571_21040 [Marinithermofilum abyssi]